MCAEMVRRLDSGIWKWRVASIDVDALGRVSMSEMERWKMK